MNAILSLEAEIASLRQMLAEKESLLLDLKRKETEKVIATSGLDGSSVAGQAPQCVGDSLPRWAIERYSRQIVLESVGVLGQARVCSGRALVVGAGGLGCPALAYLAGAGVGTLGIVDYDTVDVSNLHRQILHGEDMQGVSKVQSAAQAVKRLNSHVEVKTYDFQLTSANALDIVSQYDVVLDCSDNVATRYLVNDACILANIPLVSGSALKMEGQLAIYGYTPNPDNKGERTACYRCVFPRPPPPETVGACSAQGVLGPAPGLVGVLQALETVKLLAGRAPVTTMLLFDGEECSFRRVKLRGRNPDCAVCSDHPTVTSLVDYEMFCQSRATETQKTDVQRQYQIRKEQKLHRMSGRPYLGFRKSSDLKCVLDVAKPPRSMGPPCNSETCAKNITKLCRDFTDQQRREIFNNFWKNMDWKEKKDFVKSLIDFTPPKRRRKVLKGGVFRKGNSKVYHLPLRGERVQVCLNMFCNTIGVKQMMLRGWLHPEAVKLKKDAAKAKNVEVYLDLIDKFPSKCLQCRASVDRMYVDYRYTNMSQVYQSYVGWVGGKEAASRRTFLRVFSGRNLCVFKPKKKGDVCDLVDEHNASSYYYLEKQSVADFGEGSVLNK